MQRDQPSASRSALAPNPVITANVRRTRIIINLIARWTRAAGRLVFCRFITIIYLRYQRQDIIHLRINDPGHCRLHGRQFASVLRLVRRTRVKGITGMHGVMLSWRSCYPLIVLRGLTRSVQHVRLYRWTILAVEGFQCRRVPRALSSLESRVEPSSTRFPSSQIYLISVDHGFGNLHYSVNHLTSSKFIRSRGTYRPDDPVIKKTS